VTHGGADRAAEDAAASAPGPGRIPAFVNARSGSAADARAAVEDDPRFALHALEPAALDGALRAAAERGEPRVVVAGGDGTLASAARVLAGSRTALAILPGGTLNHFARDLGLPADDAAACLELAATAPVRAIDAAEVNGVLFLGTSSVGLYVNFVRTRERLEGAGLGYRLASALAGAWCWLRLRGYAMRVRAGERTTDGAASYTSPLVFVAVGERHLAGDAPGTRVMGGRAALHVMVLRTGTRAGVVASALRAAGPGGVAALARTDALDVAVVPACEVALPRPRGRVALDGELAPLTAPLHYRYIHDALLVVAPPGGSVGGGDGAGVRT
jgi:diacylglycerol kinase family enzyme